MAVSILVLMEVPLQQNQLLETALAAGTVSFNPCFNGSSSSTIK